VKCLENFGLREIVHWIVAGFDEQEDVFAIGDPRFPKSVRACAGNGSAYNSLLGSGSGTRNWSIAPSDIALCARTVPLLSPSVGRADLSAPLTTGPNYVVAPG